MKPQEKLVLFLLLALASLSPLGVHAQQDCSSDEQKCWSTKIERPAFIPDTPIKGKINGKDIASFYVELTKKDTITGNKYFYFVPESEKPSPPCSQIKGGLIKIGFKTLPSKGTFSLNRSKGDKSPFMQTIAYHITDDGTIKSTSGKSDVTLVLIETADKAKGWASIHFLDEKNTISGSFLAHVCK